MAGRTTAVVDSKYVRGLTPVAIYVVAGLTSMVVTVLTLHLWKMDLRVPLYYSDRGTDQLLILAWVKALTEEGWIFRLSHLGAPFTMSFGDFPVPNILHLILLRGLGLVFRDPAVATNVYFLLGFPLITLTALYASLRLGVSRSIAVCISVTYAFLPIRFMQNESHLFYTQYFMLPILALAVFWILQDHVLIDRSRRSLTRDGWLFAIGLCLVALDNQYDAVFCCVLLVFAAIASIVRSRRWDGACASAIGIVILVVTVFASIAPNVIYERAHGKDALAVIRPPAGAEVYALTFAQLVLPIAGHRVAALAQDRAFYDAGFPPLVNENSSASLGALGALGFVFGIGALLARRPFQTGGIWADAARLNIVAFFLATVGGVGAIITYYFVPDLRAYNRISPLIGFFSLVSVAYGLDQIRKRWFNARSRQWFVALGFVAVAAILDQTSVQYVPAYGADKALYTRDGQYASTLQSDLGEGAMVYQLPHVEFPETLNVVNLGAWDQLALYVQSSNLRFSYGTTRGRPDDAWILQTNMLGTEAFVQHVVMAGFSAISVYHDGYADGGASELRSLSSVLGAPQLSNSDDSVTTFDLRPLRDRYLSAIGTATAAAIAESVVHPKLGVALGSGFYGLESLGSLTWSWAPSTASLEVTNSSSVTERATLSLNVAAGMDEPATIAIEGLGVSRQFAITQAGVPIRLSVEVPPGNSSIALTTNARRVPSGADPRDIRFRLYSWEIESSITEKARAILLDELRAGSSGTRGALQ